MAEKNQIIDKEKKMQVHVCVPVHMNTSSSYLYCYSNVLDNHIIFPFHTIMCFQINCRAIILNHTLTRRARSNTHKKQHDSVSPSFFERSPKYFRNVKKMNAMFVDLHTICEWKKKLLWSLSRFGNTLFQQDHTVIVVHWCSSFVVWRSNIIFRTMIKQPLHDFQLPFVTSNI